MDIYELIPGESTPQQVNLAGQEFLAVSKGEKIPLIHGEGSWQVFQSPLGVALVQKPAPVDNRCLLLAVQISQSEYGNIGRSAHSLVVAHAVTGYLMSTLLLVIPGTVLHFGEYYYLWDGTKWRVSPDSRYYRCERYHWSIDLARQEIGGQFL